MQGPGALLALCLFINTLLCLLEQEVNELWAGLGYYSRGKRLQEAARKVLDWGRRGISKPVAGADSCLPCLAGAVLLAGGCRGWDPIFAWAKWVICTHPPKLLP